MQVAATNENGSGRADTIPLLVAAAGAPVNRALPSISGGQAVGQTLSADPGGWVGSGAISYAYQWQRCDGYAQAVLADTPVGYWPLDELNSADTVRDRSGHSPANPGRYVGSVTLGTAGPAGYEPATGVTLDGTGQVSFDTASSQPVYFGEDEFTVEGWFKTTDTSAGSHLLFSTGRLSGQAPAATSSSP